MLKAYKDFTEKISNNIAVQATLLIVSIAALAVAPFTGLPIYAIGSMGAAVIATACNLHTAIEKRQEANQAAPYEQEKSPLLKKENTPKKEVPDKKKSCAFELKPCTTPMQSKDTVKQR